MKGLAIVLALVGCYRPGSEVPCTVTCSALGECPDGLACNSLGQCALPGGGCKSDDASAIDGNLISDAPNDGIAPNPDALSDGGVMFDAPVSVTCVPGQLMSTTPLTQGTWFTPDLDGSPVLAVKLENDQIVVTESNANTNNGTHYAAMFAVATNVTYASPRLAPTLSQAFYLRVENGLVSLQRASRVAPVSWTTNAVLLKDPAGSFTTTIVGDEEIGAPTTTTPRYMLITRGATLTEYVEFSATEWRRVANHAPVFSGINFLGRATLSENGRRMVFRGQVPGTNVSGYYVDRAAPGQVFPTTATRIPSLSTDSVETPYLSEDCRHFYYTHPTSNQIQHATFQ